MRNPCPTDGSPLPCSCPRPVGARPRRARGRSVPPGPSSGCVSPLPSAWSWPCEPHLPPRASTPSPLFYLRGGWRLAAGSSAQPAHERVRALQVPQDLVGGPADVAVGAVGEQGVDREAEHERAQHEL